MSAADNVALINRFYDEGWNANNLDVYDELVTEDFLDHQAIPGMEAGRAGFRFLNVMFRAAFPDVWVTVDGIVAEDDKVSCRWTSTGTHEGELFGIPPTGKKVRVSATVWYRVEDGRLAEGWINRDDFGMMRQLGVIPTPRVRPRRGRRPAPPPPPPDSCLRRGCVRGEGSRGG